MSVDLTQPSESETRYRDEPMMKGASARQTVEEVKERFRFGDGGS